MLAKRIISCLDIKDGQTVKGTNFVNLRQAGDPVELARAYSEQGADELVFLDITASFEGRKTFTELVKRIAANISIPFTVGGGLKDIDDIKRILRAGADKVSLNSSAVKNKKLIKEGAYYFGKQCIVLAVDAKKKFDNSGWNVFINGGRIDTGIDVIKWIEEATKLGAGEILLTSMDSDGTKNGFDLELTRKVSEITNVPVIASGGGGSLKDFENVFIEGKAHAALAASLFHYGELSIKEAKLYLREMGIAVRI